MTLIQSLEKTRAKISRNGCCWIRCEGGQRVKKANGDYVKCTGGWHLTFDKPTVRSRVSEIQAEINRIENERN